VEALGIAHMMKFEEEKARDIWQQGYALSDGVWR
jgi:hypothetical protein